MSPPTILLKEVGDPARGLSKTWRENPSPKGEIMGMLHGGMMGMIGETSKNVVFAHTNG